MAKWISKLKLLLWLSNYGYPSEYQAAIMKANHGYSLENDNSHLRMALIRRMSDGTTGSTPMVASGSL